MAKVSTIRVIDSLAEITRHYDRHLIEKSLLKTIDEIYGEGSTKLFKVDGVSEGYLNLELLAYSDRGNRDTLVNSKQNRVLCEHIRQVLEQGSAHTFDDVDELGRKETIYPAYDHNGEIFAILVHRHKPYDVKDSNLVHGIIKVYSNYLALLEKTQKDKLTGLFNRETLDAELTKLLLSNGSIVWGNQVESDERRRAAGRHLKAYAGLVDVDHFKRINDRFGHLFGDEILILVSRLLMDSFFRKNDLVYRYGGEEFVVIIHALDRDDARAAFERLRTTVETQSFAQLDGLTVSIGFVEIDGQQTPADVIGEGDKALYYAKDSGRNRVVCYEEAVENGLIKPAERIVIQEVDLF